MHTDIYTYKHMYSDTYICKHTHMYTNTHAYIYSHILIYMHTHIYVHAQYTYINIYSEENYPRTPFWTLPVTFELPLLSRRQYFGERC